MAKKWKPCPVCLIEIDYSAVQIRNADGEDTGRRVDWNDRNRGEIRFAMTQAGEYLTCPRGHELPEDYLDLPTRVVGLVGPSLSMKTHFIAITTYRALQRDQYGLIDGYDVDFDASDATKKLLREEYWTLIETRKALGRTVPEQDAESPVRPPICLRVDWKYGRPGRANVGSSYLLLVDAPGELIGGTAAQQATVAPYLTRADLVLFFVDLLQVKDIRDQLSMPIPEDFRSGDYSTTIVNDAARMIRGKREIPMTRQIPTPAVVVMSKADVLAFATGWLSELVGDPLAYASYSERDRELLAEALAEEFLPGLLPKVDKGFHEYRVMLASALGSQPSESGLVPAITPLGCDEIFRHLLLKSRAVG